MNHVYYLVFLKTLIVASHIFDLSPNNNKEKLILDSYARTPYFKIMCFYFIKDYKLII